ncbi:putative MNI1 putative S-adenosylmethionine-dependent methyltransferase [Venustampulla echinocandica]|uniref:protein-histidine N-methyltransferase n=1 Tax=Venustampulla echinocandica TaxID=2656787 RepID=A0A370TSA0_9HELO|nr:putative MNI1 putative S-adenosylmethionine-dependent methyltransferase [Venustampulla echinocandica]RDL38400.1 putative MNI1 putative S-adenosylmethionine-dependent methyltransferase [Venustampulla echinocandica]
MSGFSFSFAGDDIEDDNHGVASEAPLASSSANHAAETGTLRRSSNSAFPVAGQPLLQPQKHDLEIMLKMIPSKVSYSTLTIKLDDGQEVYLPRRELWDVKVQLMAEGDDESLGNLGKDDVKTGIYEGGFKSWESSVDVVKELYKRRGEDLGIRRRFFELGCGTALPSLYVFQWLLQSSPMSGTRGLDLGLADYNPTVLQLVTLPNLLLTWAQMTKKDLWEAEGELEIDSDVVQEFLKFLNSNSVTLSFYSGGWSPEFVNLVDQTMPSRSSGLTIIGAETIYSPAALASFAETLLSLLSIPDSAGRSAMIAAKKVYFGVGGSMEDFCNLVRAQGGITEQLREESEGVRREVVEVRIKA